MRVTAEFKICRPSKFVYSNPWVHLHTCTPAILAATSMHRQTDFDRLYY